jgi:hypothetical protein
MFLTSIGVTPILSDFETACVKGHLRLAKILFNRNPDYDYTTKVGMEVACGAGQMEIIDWLVKEHNGGMFAGYGFLNACCNNKKLRIK